MASYAVVDMSERGAPSNIVIMLVPAAGLPSQDGVTVLARFPALPDAAKFALRLTGPVDDGLVLGRRWGVS